MTNNIVTVNVSQIVAPIPNTRQKTGAFVSQGATNLVAGTYSLLTQASDLTPLLNGALAISSLTWSGGVITATTTAPHGFTISDTIKLTIAGASPAGYNSTQVCTITGASTFTYAHAGSLSTPATGSPTYTVEDVAELLAMTTTFFAQGSGQGVYVLELGPGNAADGVTALQAFIASVPNFFYSYLLPRGWDGNGSYLTFLASFENTTAQTYFFTTTTNGTYTDYTPVMKCVYAAIEAPTIPATEFSLAADFWVTLHYAPSSTNKVTPLAFSFVYGVTPYPTVGNSALFTALKAAGVNWKATGAEGGLSNVIILWGTTMDVRPFNYWYSTDWAQINIDLAIANAVINGSNNPANPLDYNQNGIDRLQMVGASTLASGVTYGLILGRVVQSALDGPSFGAALDDGDFAGQAAINAIPFVPYNKANPSDYKNGVYNGFAVVMTPLRGFEQITFNVTVTDFVA